MPLSKTEARARVLSTINEEYDDPEDTLVILDEDTIATSYGWIFFYDSKRHQETGSFLDALGGGGPVVVEAESGRVTPLGSAKSAEHEIAAFERERGLPASAKS